MKRLSLCLFLSLTALSSWAASPPADTDNDQIADTLELWLAAEGITDDNGTAFAIGTNNVLNADQDQDGIPDKIEIEAMNQDAAGYTNCQGELTGRAGLRIYSGTFSNRDFGNQYLTAYSVCHNNQTNDLILYSPLWGMGSGTASLGNPGIYTVTLSWASANVSLTAGTWNTADLATPMTGTITIGGTQRNFRSRLATQGTIPTNQTAGIFAAQMKQISASGPLASVINDPLVIGSEVGQIVTSAAAATPNVVLYDIDDLPLAGYYDSETGGLFIAGIRNGENLALRALVLRPTSNSEGGLIRGEVISSEAGSTEIVNFYASAKLPQLAFFTEINANSRNLYIQVFNLPTSADSLSIALNGSEILNVNAANSANYFRLRNRIPAFTNDPNIGISGANQRVSAVGYVTTNTNGNYTVTVTGNQQATPTLAGTYTDSGANIDLVTNIQINGMPWTGTITDIAPDQNISITHSGAANADQYTFSMGRQDNDILNNYDANRLLYRPGTNTTFTIEAGTLEINTTYCGRIRARLTGTPQVRSRTAKLCFTTNSGGNTGGGGSGGNTGGGGGGGGSMSLALLMMLLSVLVLFRTKRSV